MYNVHTTAIAIKPGSSAYEITALPRHVAIFSFGSNVNKYSLNKYILMSML
jgi:hypothetical protein